MSNEMPPCLAEQIARFSDDTLRRGLELSRQYGTSSAELHLSADFLLSVKQFCCSMNQLAGRRGTPPRPMN